MGQSLKLVIGKWQDTWSVFPGHGSVGLVKDIIKSNSFLR
jgi:hypothetical protein